MSKTWSFVAIGALCLSCSNLCLCCSSKNGSPVDPVDEGALVATVTKKRRGNAPPATAANFDISIGEGKYISLNDPTGVKHLDENMKSNALTQLKVLQDQMASLMEQLTTKETK